MTFNGESNTYEEVRKQRLEENKKRFEDLGIAKISKSLADLANSEKKSPKRHLPKPKSKSACMVEPRRSSRARNPVQSYCDEVFIDLPSTRKRSRTSSSSWGSGFSIEVVEAFSYLARPLEEVKVASYEERRAALKAAEELQSNLKSGNPSFVKSMVRSHVYSCFWLGLPSKFCEDHLPKSVVDMELENEDGKEYEAIYIGKRSGLSGGWRAFALDHKLDDGDALVFELIEPTRFKIYIVRASMLSSGSNMVTKEDTTEAEEKSKVTMKLASQSKQQKKLKNVKSRKLSVKCLLDGEMKQDVSPAKMRGFISKRVKKEGGQSEEASETNEAASVQESSKFTSRKSRRKLTPKSSRHSLV
ncbi:B3 DNA binding domain containing protein [Parasponia andersonii]|uniref:B3 DNA binding domain containing protein n=1 Tax=Parasponia andersonii TaxID=3476 RepID=A0A2P5DHU6_PARAD|nr:B3 DNA binding domain containing protein [Parasponia andersonii]